MGPLFFHMNFKFRLLFYAEMEAGILIGIILNLWINLGSIVILVTLHLSIHGHGISFYLFRSFQISSNYVLFFSANKSCTSVIKNLAPFFFFFDVWPLTAYAALSPFCSPSDQADEKGCIFPLALVESSNCVQEYSLYFYS